MSNRFKKAIYRGWTVGDTLSYNYFFGGEGLLFKPRFEERKNIWELLERVNGNFDKILDKVTD